MTRKDKDMFQNRSLIKHLMIGCTLIGILSAQSIAQANTDGLKRYSSKYSVNETTSRFIALIKSKGLKHFATIDHAEGATGVGMDLRPTRLVIFGNPKIGSEIMKCKQETAIDLPLKALIWEDKHEKVWFGYNTSKYIAQRHKVSTCQTVLGRVEKALANFAKHATGAN